MKKLPGASGEFIYVLQKEMDRKEEQDTGNTEKADDKRVYKRQRKRDPDLAAEKIDDP